MTYDTECTGTPVLDIHRQVDIPGTYIFSKGCINAVTIKPTSRCLDSMTILGIRRLADYDLIIEIRENNLTTNLPKGSPGSSDGLLSKITIPYSNIPQSFSDITVTSMKFLFPVANTIYWIVVYSSDFECTVPNLVENRYELSYANVDNSYSSTRYCALTTPCNWVGNFIGNSFALATYKKEVSTKEGVSTGVVVGLIVVAGVAAAILYFATRGQK